MRSYKADCQHDEGCAGSPDMVYYVSVLDGSKSVIAAGPYETHAAALARVATIRQKVEILDPIRFPFWAFGTCGIERNATIRPYFGIV